MLVAIDIGNSKVHCGYFREEYLISNWSCASCDFRPAGLFPGKLKKYILQDIKGEKIEGCIAACVVPDLRDGFTSECMKLFKKELFFVNARMKMDIKIKYENPEELGADRIANAAACHKFYPGDAIIADFGTATTFCVLTGKGEYEGGLIVPGIEMSMKALAEKTALLPEIDLQELSDIVGKTTEDSIRSGIVYGFTELADGVVDRLRKESVPGARVIATGGWAWLISRFSRTIKVTDPFLTLNGLQILYEMNC